jgi:ATP-dependent Clp protease ATP-binding subunit ClpX
MDKVELIFEEDAIRAIAARAIERNTGARGLRAILEEIMLDVMYEIPSQENVESVTITESVLTKGEKPLVKYKTPEEQ